MKITVENFQSISKAQVEIKGLTIITGQNNTGKSALARAVSSVFTNPRGNSFVRIGSPSTSVEIDFEDGNTVKWSKGKNINQYEVNGKLIQKVGTDVPDEVYQASLVKSVEIDGKEVHPQIAKQFQQVFLIDLPPSTLASALSNVELIQQLEKASSLARSDIKDISTQLKSKNNDLIASKDHLKKFNGIDQVEHTLKHIKNLESQIKMKNDMLSSIEQDCTLRKQLQAIISELETLEQIQIDTNPESVLSLENRYNDVYANHTRRTAFLSTIENLSGVLHINFSNQDVIEKKDRMLKEASDLCLKKERLFKAYLTLQDITRVQQIDYEHTQITTRTTNLNEIVDLKERQQKAYDLFQSLKDIGNVNFEIDTDRIVLLDEIVRLKKSRTRLKLAVFILEGGLKTMPIVKEMRERKELDEIENLKGNRERLNQAVGIIDTELKKIDQELKELHIGDVCPLCNQGIGH
jgi:glutaredoxin-related protein